MGIAPSVVAESVRNTSYRWYMTSGSWPRVACCTLTALTPNALYVLAQKLQCSHHFHMTRSKFPQKFFSHEAEWDFGTYFTFNPLEFPNIYRGNQAANSYLCIEKAGCVESPAPCQSSSTTQWCIYNGITSNSAINLLPAISCHYHQSNVYAKCIVELFTPALPLFFGFVESCKTKLMMLI